MNRPTEASDEAVLGALEGIVRMQRGIRSSDIDVCIETGLVFLRINYQSLPGNIARRLTEIDPRAVEEIPAATDKGGSREKQRALAAKLASDAAFAQAIRAANVYREKTGHGPLGPDGWPEDQGGEEKRPIIKHGSLSARKTGERQSRSSSRKKDSFLQTNPGSTARSSPGRSGMSSMRWTHSRATSIFAEQSRPL